MFTFIISDNYAPFNVNKFFSFCLNIINRRSMSQDFLLDSFVINTKIETKSGSKGPISSFPLLLY